MTFAPKNYVLQDGPNDSMWAPVPVDIDGLPEPTIVAGSPALETINGDVPRTPFSIFQSPETSETQSIVIGSSSASQMSFALADALAVLGISVHNAGVGGERGRWTEARIGSDPLVLTFPNDTIPASGSVVVSITGTLPLGTLNSIPGRTATVPGTVSVSGGVVSWTRTTSGSAVKLPGAVPHIPTQGETYRDSLHIVLSAYKNDMGTADADRRAIEGVQRIIEHMAASRRRFIVVTLFSDTGTNPASLEKSQTINTTQEWILRYGPVVFDLYGYLTGSQVWIDTGITATSADLEQQSLGNLPASLANPGDAQHMNPTTRTQVALRIRELLIAVGWYTMPDFQTLTSDTFSGGNAGTLLGRVSDAGLGGTGMTWAGTDQVLAINSGHIEKGASASTSWFNGILIPDEPDVEFSATVTTFPAAVTSLAFDVCRVGTAATDGYRLAFFSGGTVRLRKRVSGTQTYLGTALPIQSGDRIGLRRQGDTLSIVHNGEVVQTVTDTSIVGSGYAGISGAQDTGFVFDDVVISGLSL